MDIIAVKMMDQPVKMTGASNVVIAQISMVKPGTTKRQNKAVITSVNTMFKPVLKMGVALL